MSNMRRCATAALVLALVAPARAQCPSEAAKRCVLTLEGEGAPSASPSCLAEPWTRFLSFDQAGRFTDSNGDKSWETVVTIDLDPAKACRTLGMRLTFGRSVTGFPLNVGDSPTNNGYGGDASTTSRCAELQIDHPWQGGDFLRVFTPTLSPSNAVGELLHLGLPPLTGRSMVLEVRDQHFELALEPMPADGRPLTVVMDGMATGHLFALAGQPDPGAPGGSAPDYRLHVAFNRVIHRRDGAPWEGRIGTGVRRVELYLTP